MIWAWRIFSSVRGRRLIAAGIAMAALPLAAGDLSGTVQLRDSREASVRKKLDYSGVVLWLEGPGVKPDGVETHAKMIQKDKTFTPHVLAIPVGGTVDFPNLDPFFHNAFSNYSGQIFDVGLYPPKTSRAVRFTRPGIVRIFCNIHANMSAVIAVLDSDRFTVTAKDGSFTLADVPPGDYTLHVFHERATDATLRALTRRVSAGTGRTVLPPIEISETGYLPAPHQNKYGRPYPEDGGGTYPTNK